MSERTWCCEVALASSASLAGTAVKVDAWLLVEYAYAWKAKAVEDNILPGNVLEAFDRITAEFAALGIKLRIQFVKQAASELNAPSVLFADGRDGSTRLLRKRLTGYDDLAALTAAGLLDGERHGFDTMTGEIYLVCTNGQRDLCCARFGRPLYSELHAAIDERAWQTTHLGGHRYAPNLLCLPSGYVYGFVDPEVGQALVRQHDEGLLDLERLRGRSHYEPVVQAGEIHARMRHDLRGIDALHCERDAVTTEGGRTVVRYTGDASGELALAEQSLPNDVSTCEANPKPRVEFSLLA